MPRVKPIKGILSASAISVSAAFLFWSVQAGSANRGPQQAKLAGVANAQNQDNDGLPTVKITAPINSGSYQWNALVNYSIVVSDQGKSTQYQEIPSKDVLLATTYVLDLSPVTVNSAQAAAPTPAGLQGIMSSNCLGCHEFKARAMGPSFSAISQRYPDSEATVDTLAQHILDGSQGIWGQASMPPHQELTESQVHAIALWIMKHASDPNVNYYVGTEGTFQMEAPGRPGPKGGLILTASYTRPGATRQPAARGEDTIAVYGK